MLAAVTYRKASKQDGINLYPLAKSLATSFDVNKVGFSIVVASLIEDPNTDLLVAEKNQELIGYVLVLHHPAFYSNGSGRAAI